MSVVLLRPMRPDDVPAVEQLTGEAFYQVDLHKAPPGLPPARRREGEASQRWRRRCAHLVAHDPGGCWVAADDEGELLGAVASIRRESMWFLSTYAVLPPAQGRGIGKALLAAALGYGEGCLRGMVVASPDTRAVRRYRHAGFVLHPHMLLAGTVRRAALPVPENVREGGSADLDLADSVDRRTRGAGHGVDHPFMLASMPMLVVDRSSGSGYCYVEQGGRPYVLAATSRRTAARLLWAALATSQVDGHVVVPNITAEQQWALDVGLAAGLDVHQYGYLAVRHMRPPPTYLPSGHFL